jgi:acetoin utilization deacetylase AcuC-like enzyme
VAMATGFVSHEIYHWHDTGNWNLYLPPGFDMQPGQNAENAETKRRLRNLVEVSGLIDHLTPVKARPATEDELARFHTREHIAAIKAKSQGYLEDAGGMTAMGRGSYEIACLAAGGTIAAVDAVLDGRVANAYAPVRPPGHHATRTTAMGYCLFGNAAIAIMHAIAERGLKRVAAFDWDVHHGNGTQSAFYGRSFRSTRMAAFRMTRATFPSAARARGRVTTSTSRSPPGPATAPIWRRWSAWWSRRLSALNRS